MAPPNLQGLNIVHPAIHGDSHDLLAGQQYHDLSAQLDLWTNLAFDSEDGLSTARPGIEDKYNRKHGEEEEEEALEEEEEAPTALVDDGTGTSGAEGAHSFEAEAGEGSGIGVGGE